MLKLPPNTLNLHQWLQQQIGELVKRETLTGLDVPLYRLRQNGMVTYRSAIAFKLTSLKQVSPMALSYQLLEALAAQANPLGTSSEVCVHAVSPGWLDFQLSDRAIALWLEQLPKLFPASKRLAELIEPSNGFPIQYVHARCCSLLRLGHQQGLIALKEQDLSQPVWQWESPKPIPLLNTWVHPEQLWLVKTDEQHLLDRLLDSTEIPWVSQPSVFKLMTDLSRAILQFEQNCCLWGVINDTPQLAQARLGLLAVAQFVLRELLEQLNLAAPVEL